MLIGSRAGSEQGKGRRPGDEAWGVYIGGRSLLAITIIGILIGAAVAGRAEPRESGRRTQCSNNLKQLTSAAMQHETVHRSYPTGGWGGMTISLDQRLEQELVGRSELRHGTKPAGRLDLQHSAFHRATGRA